MSDPANTTGEPHPMDTPVPDRRKLSSDFTTAATLTTPQLTYYANGTRVRRVGFRATSNALGTTEGMTVDAEGPLQYQVVKWDNGRTTLTTPDRLARIPDPTPNVAAVLATAGAAK